MVSGDEVSDGVSGDPVPESVEQAVAELYGAAPDTFTERRGELATAARSAGDRAAAKAIGALRRPTRAAWVVNRLARTNPSAPARLAELGEALRAAEQARQGARLRELSAARGTLIDGLTAQALAGAGVAEPPAGLRDEVAATLTAALADPAVAAEFAAGTLTRAAHWSGFGSVDFGAFGADTAAGSATETGTVNDSSTAPDASAASSAGAATGAGDSAGGRAARTRGTADGTSAPGRPEGRRLTLVPPRPQAPAGGAPEREAPARRPKAASAAPERATADADTDRDTARAAAAADAAQAAARRAALAEEELARAAAERAAQRRQKYEEAERVLAAAVSAAADAGAAEERLEAEVRELEDRLTRARAELAATRMNARHAEAAERRARTAIDRLPAG